MEEGQPLGGNLGADLGAKMQPEADGGAGKDDPVWPVEKPESWH